MEESLTVGKALILALLSLFHHSHKPPVDVMGFLHDAVVTLQSYEDGSVNEALEYPQIIQLQQDLLELAHHPKDDSQGEMLMDQITQELVTLHASDEVLATEDFI